MLDYDSLQDVLAALVQNPEQVDLSQVTSEEILGKVSMWIRKQPGFHREKQYLMQRELVPREGSPTTLAKIDPEAAETMLQALIEQKAPVAKLVYPFLCTKLNSMAMYLGSADDLCSVLIEHIGSCYASSIRYDFMLAFGKLEEQNVLVQTEGAITILNTLGSVRRKEAFSSQTAVIAEGEDNIPYVVSITDPKPFQGSAKTPEGYREKCFR